MPLVLYGLSCCSTTTSRTLSPSPPSSTMSFNNASGFIFNGRDFNNVSGDQFNVTGGVVHIGQRAVVKPTKYDEFEHVKTGDVYLLKETYRRNILSCGCRWENCDCNAYHRAQRTVYSAELVKQRTKYTAMTYNGPEAQEFWEKDFRRFSQNRTPKAWQLYGLNRSNVPFLIFHDELVPLGHFHTHSFWGDLSVELLRLELGCNASEIWLNTRGDLIQGPEGPDFRVPGVETPHNITVPSSAKMLQEDISFQFFQQFTSMMMDHLIVECALNNFSMLPLMGLSYQAPFNTLPKGTIGRLRLDTVYSPSLGAVARWRDGGALWKIDSKAGLVDKTVLDDGRIRFKLDGREVDVCSSSRKEDFCESWISQSSRIIDPCRMLGTKEQYYILLPSVFLDLKSRSSSSWNQQRHSRFESPPPIYLFIYPLPMMWAKIESWGEKNRAYFWSLDENGRSKMTEEECRRWMVPELYTQLCTFEPGLVSWSSYAYAGIHNWQVARGFNPATADFARRLGHPELDILINNETTGSRFEEVHETSSSGSSTPETWSNQSALEDLDIRLPAEVAIPQPLQFTMPPNHSMTNTQSRAESPPQMQPMMVDSSDPANILGKRQRGSEIQTRNTKRRV